MKSKILFVCSLISFFLGLGVLIAIWNGKASVNLAWPMSGSEVQLSGGATGWRAMAGLGGLLLGPILFVWGLVSLADRSRRRARAEALPEPHAASDAKGQAASQ